MREVVDEPATEMGCGQAFKSYMQGVFMRTDQSRDKGEFKEGNK